MGIKHQEGDKPEFYIERGGERVARLQYFESRAGEINIYHTEVDDSLSGQGVGKELVTEAVRYAREHRAKIVPSCPFARKVIEGTPEFRDILSS